MTAKPQKEEVYEESMNTHSQLNGVKSTEKSRTTISSANNSESIMGTNSMVPLKGYQKLSKKRMCHINHQRSH